MKAIITFGFVGDENALGVTFQEPDDTSVTGVVEQHVEPENFDVQGYVTQVTRHENEPLTQFMARVADELLEQQATL